MNICFLITDISWRGGTNNMTSWLSDALSRSNKVYVLSLHKEFSEYFFPLSSKVTCDYINNNNLSCDYCTYIRKIRNYLKSKSIDILISVDTGISIYSIPASQFLKVKVVNWEHSNYYNNWGSKYFAYFRRFAAKKSDAVVVLTSRDKQNYENNIKKCVPISVIPNPSKARKYSYDIGSKTILSAGILGKIKRFELIVPIGKAVFAKHPDWKWVVCGDGPEKENLENAVKEAGLCKNIIFLGSVSDMETEYAAAAMYVLTSEMEGLPMVLLEAKSQGLPIISFDIETGPSDIVRDGVNGYLVESGNTDVMADKICNLIESPALRTSFSEKSGLDMEKFDEEHIVKQWETLIRSL